MTTLEQPIPVDRPWLAHYDPGVPGDVEIPPLPVDALLRRSAERHPDRPALIFFGAKTTFAELDEAADRFAHVLRSMGVQKGDRVSLHLPTSPAFVIAFMGAMRAGALAVPMNPLYVERELGILFGQTQPKVSVAIDLLVPRLQGMTSGGNGSIASGSDLGAGAVAHRSGGAAAASEGGAAASEVGAAPRAAGPGRRSPFAQPEPPGLPGRLIVTGIQDSLPIPIRYLYPLKARREGRWKPQPHRPETPNLFRLLREAPAIRFESVARPEDPAVLQPTGGTTGIPKAAVLTHRNLVANAVQVAAWFPSANERDGAKILCPLPLFHIYGLTVDMNYAMLIGATLLLLPRFDPEQVLKTAARYRPGLFPGAPVMYETLAHHPSVGRYDLSSIEACISGAAALPPEVERDFEAITGGRVCEGYGLTEASPVTHCNPVVGDRRLGTIGLPFPSTDARVIDPATGLPVPDGQVGELEVAGPQVMSGYWHRPDESAAVLHHGWLRTGDLATRDNEGYFTIVDRVKDLIIVGGINVYPREIEEVLMGHPAVADAAVIGMPHGHYGEVPCAFVVLAEGATATEAELIAYCRENLARFKVPLAIRFRPKLPKTMIGKVLRKDLREEVPSGPASG